MLSKEQHDNLVTAYSTAQAIEHTTELPALFSTAQYAIESGYGLHVSGDFNYWGIKATPSTPADKKKLCHTSEWFTTAEAAHFIAQDLARTAVVFKGKDSATLTKGPRSLYSVQDWFASYGSIEESFARHATLLTKGRPYTQAWSLFQGDHNVIGLVRRVGAMYSTAEGYADMILREMNYIAGLLGVAKVV